MTGTVNCTWHFLFPPKRSRVGRLDWPGWTCPSRVASFGSAVVRAFIFGIRTGIWSSWLRLVVGRFIDATAAESYLLLADEPRCRAGCGDRGFRAGRGGAGWRIGSGQLKGFVFEPAGRYRFSGHRERLFPRKTG